MNTDMSKHFENDGSPRTEQSAPSTGSTVPFSEAVFDDTRDKVKLTNGFSCSLPGDRRVEVWRVEGEDGFCIRIFRPTKDGKRSKLMFGLRPDAAEALTMCLVKQLNNKDQR